MNFFQYDMSVGQTKYLSPNRNWTHNLPNTWRHYKNAWRARSFNWVHTVYVTGVLPSARISTVKIIVSGDKSMKMVNVELGNEMWKMNFSIWNTRGTKKISESPAGLTYVTYELSLKMTLLSMSSCSSVDRAPAMCLGGHGFDSCRGLRYFLRPTLVLYNWKKIHLSHFITKLNIHHLLWLIISLIVKN